jgi:hypothetical protein
MIKYLLVFLVISLPEIILGQAKKDSIQQPSSSYLSVAVGLASPYGNYAAKNITNNTSGFAKTGLSFDASIAKILWWRTGAVLMYRNQINKVDVPTLINQYSQKYPNIDRTVLYNPWKINSFMIGSYSSFPLGRTRYLSLDIKLMLGMVRATSPQMTLNSPLGFNTTSVQQVTNSASTFAYCFGLGFKLYVTRFFFMVLQADYLGAKPKFENVPTVVSAGNIIMNNFTQSISTLNLNIGFAYRIN